MKGQKVLVRRSEFDTWLAQYRQRGKPIVTRILRELGLDPERLPDTRAPWTGLGRHTERAAPMTFRLVYGAPGAVKPDRSGGDAMGAATITASYIKHGKKWRVLIRPANNAPRITRVVRSEQEAKELVRHFNRLEAGADLRWVRDQLGHASIEETEGTYGHLERERHERRVDVDAVLGIG
jgi:integrase